MRRCWLVAGLCLALSACDDDGGGSPRTVDIPDAGPDAVAAPDTGEPDVGRDAEPPDDAEPTEDALTPDDVYEPDAAVPDAEVPDAMPLPACGNGVDDDGDGIIDYPLDPGCETTADDDETDPATAACGDGEDNDDDTLIDADDPGCSSPDDPSETDDCGADQSFVDLTATGHFEGTTEGLPSAFVAGCRNNNAPEAVFLFTLRDAERVERLVFDTAGSALDTVLSIRSVCDDGLSEIACNDDMAPGIRTSQIVLDGPANGDYFVIVDGFGDSSATFVLDVRAEIPAGDPCPPADGAVVCRRGSTCVGDVCLPHDCADGVDNDSDGRTDWPEEPGCETPEDDDETNPVPPPQCSDGADNDFNGLADWPDDPRCSSAGDPEEQPPPQCGDGIDNDNDTLVDLDDPGCNGDPLRSSEFNVDACRDGQDNDGDERIDYPNDPGCQSPRDPDESDPEVVPECADGIDNDEDGSTDYPEDVDGCIFAADPTEADPCVGLEPREITGLEIVRGNIEALPNEFSSLCAPRTGREEVLLWEVRDDRPLESMRLISRRSRFDTVLHIRDRCNAPTAEEIACDDNGGAAGSSVIQLGPQTPGERLYLFVDSGNADVSGVYRIEIRASLALGANCAGGGAYACADGLACRADPDGAQRCVVAVCADADDNDGDGIVDYPADPGCESASDDDEEDPLRLAACSNGIDDDGDGLTDYGEDPRCDSAADEFEGPDCSDRIDNNDNGALDYDRDGDGFRDANADPACVCAEDEEESQQPQCRDGCDNDRDGLVDIEDPGCLGDPERNVEFNVALCRDGSDNDGDGWIDFPNDPGCTRAEDALEDDPVPLPECADGIDNDEDGRIDFDRGQGAADDGCLSAADDNEAGPCDREQPPLADDGVATGNTVGSIHEHVGGCGFGEAPEDVYVATIPYPAFVEANTFDSQYDTTLYVRSACTSLTVCPEPLPSDAGMPDSGPSDSGPSDSGPSDAAVPDAAVPDAAVPDAAVSDAAELDAAVPDAAAPNICEPQNTQLGCNDDTNGLQSRVQFEWDGGEFYLFVDGFGASAGNYTLTVLATYPADGQCGPDSPAWADCAEGTECRDNEAAGFPTCQPPR